MKDYWTQAYKEFFYLGLFGVFLDIVVFTAWITDSELKRTIISETGDVSIFIWLVLPISTIVWLTLGLAFKKRKVWTIKFGYTLIGILLLSSLYPFPSFITLIYLYFLWVIRRAQTRPTVLDPSVKVNKSVLSKILGKVGFVLLALVILLFIGSYSPESEPLKLSQTLTSQIADESNKSLPLVLDSDLTFVSIVGIEGGLIYEFKFSTKQEDELYLGEKKERIASDSIEIKNTFCSSNSPDIEFLRDAEALLTFRYYDIVDNYIDEYVIDFSQCE